MRRVSLLPNLLTLANAFCGLLALSKAIDALASAATHPALFYAKMETACWLVLLGMVFDAIDGKVARITGGSSHFGAQLDSFSDALTFGCVPALLAKVLIEHEGPRLGYHGSPRLHFIAAAAFALMAILRLARFNLENDPDEKSHQSFKGLPSPAAAGAVISAILLYLTMSRPELEVDDGTPTPLGKALAIFPEIQVNMPWWSLPTLAVMLPCLGLLMVSRVPYPHMISYLARRGSFFALVWLVFAACLFFAAPVPAMFVVSQAFVIIGLLRYFLRRRRQERTPEPEDSFTPAER